MEKIHKYCMHYVATTYSFINEKYYKESLRTFFISLTEKI